MKDATHFIETFKVPQRNKTKNSPVYPIGYLKPALELTRNLGFKTIAIWKIKLK